MNYLHIGAAYLIGDKGLGGGSSEATCSSVYTRTEPRDSIALASNDN